MKEWRKSSIIKRSCNLFEVIQHSRFVRETRCALSESSKLMCPPCSGLKLICSSALELNL